MVNNFDIISDYLTFSDNDTYYHLQIIRRGKDNQDMPAANRVIKTIEPIGDKIKIIIPTKSGLHIITSPFRLDKFKELFPDIEVHKNNPTNLYIP